MISPPAVEFEPDSKRSERGRPKQAGAQLDQILLRGQDEIGPQPVGPTFQRRHVLRRIGVMIGEDAEVEELAAKRLQGAPKSFRVADPAKSRDAIGPRAGRRGEACPRCR